MARGVLPGVAGERNEPDDARFLDGERGPR